MSDRLVQGGEVLTAVEASAVRAQEVGYDKALQELGFDAGQLRAACDREAVSWARQIAASPTWGDIIASLASAELVGITAGVRLGRMYAPDRLVGLSPGAADALLATVHELRAASRALDDQGFGEVAEALRTCAGRVQIVVDTERAPA